MLVSDITVRFFAYPDSNLPATGGRGYLIAPDGKVYVCVARWTDAWGNDGMSSWRSTCFSTAGDLIRAGYVSVPTLAAVREIVASYTDDMDGKMPPPETFEHLLGKG